MTVWDIRTLPIFTGLNTMQIYSIIGSFSLAQYRKGASICKFGDYDQDMFIVVKGCVKVLSGTGVILGYLNEKDIFGEIGFVYGISRNATVIAEEDSTIAILDKWQFENVSQVDPAVKTVLYKNIMLNIVNKLNLANSMIEQITNENENTAGKPKTSNVECERSM